MKQWVGMVVSPVSGTGSVHIGMMHLNKECPYLPKIGDDWRKNLVVVDADMLSSPFLRDVGVCNKCARRYKSAATTFHPDLLRRMTVKRLNGGV